tara:strand:+ start:8324 stop:9079 length:756 start_codon:yes stop_codon:yes gene_type:complete
MIIEIYKRVGETTGDLANRIKAEHNADKVAICGKLDPMARGITTALIDGSTKLMSKYLTTIKTYEFKLVLNIKTDTDDIMGMITGHNSQKITDEYISKCKHYIDELCAFNTQHFHPFSAIKVKINGERKSLHYWALKGELDMNDLPTKVVTVLEKEYGDAYQIQFSSYHRQVIERLSKVNSQQKRVFRIPSIAHSWDNILMENGNSNDKITILPIKMKVTSGFYIRMLAYYLKKIYDIDSHIFDIHRIGIN